LKKHFVVGKSERLRGFKLFVLNRALWYMWGGSKYTAQEVLMQGFGKVFQRLSVANFSCRLRNHAAFC